MMTIRVRLLSVTSHNIIEFLYYWLIFYIFCSRSLCSAASFNSYSVLKPICPQVQFSNLREDSDFSTHFCFPRSGMKDQWWWWRLFRDIASWIVLSSYIVMKLLKAQPVNFDLVNFLPKNKTQPMIVWSNYTAWKSGLLIWNQLWEGNQPWKLIIIACNQLTFILLATKVRGVLGSMGSRNSWSHTGNLGSDGSFRVKTAYWHSSVRSPCRKPNTSDVSNDIWKKIWKGFIPVASKSHTWSVCNSILPALERLPSKHVVWSLKHLF